MYFVRSIRAAPATTVIRVRTTPTNRASTIAGAPYLAKNASVRSMCRLSTNWRRPSPRRNASPSRWPIPYPTMLPSTAAAPISRHTSHTGCRTAPDAANMPMLNSSVSPGRKNPTSRPHSAKITPAEIHSAQAPPPAKMCSGLSHPRKSTGGSVGASANLAHTSLTRHSPAAGTRSPQEARRVSDAVGGIAVQVDVHSSGQDEARDEEDATYTVDDEEVVNGPRIVRNLLGSLVQNIGSPTDADLPGATFRSVRRALDLHPLDAVRHRDEQVVDLRLDRHRDSHVAQKEPCCRDRARSDAKHRGLRSAGEQISGQFVIDCHSLKM